MKHKNDLEFFCKLVKSEEGAMGYLLAWLMGVPASLLVVIYLLRGHH